MGEGLSYWCLNVYQTGYVIEVKKMKQMIKSILEKPLNWFYAKSPYCNKLDLAIFTEALEVKLDRNAILHGKNLAYRMAHLKPRDLQTINEQEFKVFSQFGEDGIIQYLVNNIEIENPVFVEFGVEDFTESNCRFLLMNNNWQGLVMDASEENIQRIQNSSLYWLHNLKAKKAFVNAENINDLIKNEGIYGDIGLLSIDIDSNDYWVWKSINVIRPRIVICEWNSVFGPKASVTIPYCNNSKYQTRYDSHYSGLCFGASLEALKSLANEKGYCFIGSNCAGNNAFFIREDLAEPFKNLIENAIYRESQFRESKDENGNSTLLSGDARINAILDCEVYDTAKNQIRKLRDVIYGSKE